MTARAVRVLPSLTGGLLGLGVGSLIVNGLCAGRPEPDGVEFLSFAVVLWIVAAAGIFVANEAWRGRSAADCVRAVGWCLAIALGLLLFPLVLLSAAVNVLEGLGGHL